MSIPTAIPAPDYFSVVIEWTGDLEDRSIPIEVDDEQPTARFLEDQSRRRSRLRKIAVAVLALGTLLGVALVQLRRRHAF